MGVSYFAKTVANIGAKSVKASKCRISLSEFNSSILTLNGS